MPTNKDLIEKGLRRVMGCLWRHYMRTNKDLIEKGLRHKDGNAVGHFNERTKTSLKRDCDP